VRDTLPRLLGRVAEWQTRWLQVPVSFGTWGFKSPFAHNERFYRIATHEVTNSSGFVTFVFWALSQYPSTSTTLRGFRRANPQTGTN
jgi:hypothetical protein